ncbi:hypothetical protein [Marinobacter sp. F3R11]|uniref:hypothetical protein n=1 Tax=Marinobacter sp. F3R11 TaxID=2267231 RepID=UPI000DE958E7|nr:hypothetical protein [Marinobacter sp. F3R11]RBW52099.1 hypothetical protein DS878_01860 [Marinobacter sp. F3R11]
MIRFCVLLALLLPVMGHAHYIPEDARLEVSASVAATWRSSSLVDEYEFWQIPGTMMGGHAWPQEKGVSVDEATLTVGSRINERVFGVIEIGSHGGGDDHSDEVELQHAYLGYVCCDSAGPWVLEAGKMSAVFSPSLASHAVDRWISDSPLINDVFFGRDFHDEGVRFWWHETAGVSAGVEVWRGNAYPATDTGDTNWDVFASYLWQGERFTLSGGGWFYQASASSRADHRYGGTHIHTPVAPPGVTATLFPDTRFTGDTDIAGLHGAIRYNPQPHWQWGVEAELMQMNMDGILHDSTGRQASVDSDQFGAWVQPYLQWRRHTMGLRGEWLSTDNHLVGAAAPVLATDSGLANPQDHDPERYTAFWHWQWRDNLALRTEVTEDRTLPESDLRWSVGVVWSGQLWPATSASGAGHHH